MNAKPQTRTQTRLGLSVEVCGAVCYHYNGIRQSAEGFQEERQQWRSSLIMKYDKEVNPFYKSKAWRQLRAQVLLRDKYLCQDCLAARRRGSTAPIRTATVVHHLQPLSECPEKGMDMDNLISLCEVCHNRRHPEKGGGNAKPTELPRGVRIVKV